MILKEIEDVCRVGSWIWIPKKKANILWLTLIKAQPTKYFIWTAQKLKGFG